MIKLILSASLLIVGGHTVGNSKSDQKYIDIDKFPKANIDYNPVFQHRIPDSKRKKDTLKYDANIYSIYKWLGKEDEPLGTYNIYGFSLYCNNKPVFKKDSVFLNSPVEVSKDSTKFTFSLLHDIDGDRSPYGDIFISDIKTRKTFSIHAFKPINGPFCNKGRSFIFANDNTICAYNIAQHKETDLLHIVSENQFSIIGLILLDDGKTLRVLFSNDEGEDNTCTGMDIPLDAALISD